MNKGLNVTVFCCLSIIILLGCGGSASKSGNVLPMVSAGVDVAYNEKEKVFLYGGASDPDGAVVSTYWSQLEGPSVAIINDTSIKAEFVAPIVQETTVLAFELSATDNLGSKNSSVVNITVNPVNDLPLVSAGLDLVYNEEEKIFLYGEASDPDGTVASISWYQLEGTNVAIINDTSIRAEFVAPIVQETEVLVFELSVTDNLGAKSSAVVNITINPMNEPPVVSAGLDFEEYAGSTVTLLGEVTDTDGEILSTSWQQLEGVSVELNDASSVSTTFIAPTLLLEEKSQVLVFELTVTDDLEAVSTDSISITINPTNELPIAKAGEDQILAPNSKVTLDCSQSYDPEGSELNILWVQISGSSTTLDDNFSCLTTFNLPNTAEVFEFALTVENSKGKSSTDFISITSTPTKLPLLTINSFEYQGGFRLSGEKFGNTNGSNLSYSPGVIAFNNKSSSLFVVGHAHEQGIAEFKIPAIVNSHDIREFNIGSEVIQNFSQFHNTKKVDTGINENFRVTGMQLIESKLVVNYINWYDSNGAETDTTVVFQNAFNLDESIIVGPFQIDGAAHTAGWLTPIPDVWQEILLGTYISGYSGGSIISRLSVGPSGFVLIPELDLVNEVKGGRVSSAPVLDFSLSNMLYNKSVYGDSYNSADDILYNENLMNNLWTIVSGASYGFIVPGTNTYATLGYTGGHESGLGYKIKQDTGNVCGGPCTMVADDNYNYVWLWEVSDLVKVKNGDMAPHDVRPYEHAVLDTISKARLTGAAFDAESMSLYLSLKNGDTVPQYATLPLFLKYKINVQ